MNADLRDRLRGELPGEWDVLPLKQACSLVADYGVNLPASEYGTGTVRFLRTTDLRDDGGLIPHEEGVFVERDLVRDKILAAGDLLVSRSGTVGLSYLARDEYEGDMGFAGYLVRFRPRPEFEPRFFFYFTKSQLFDDQIAADSTATTIENFSGQRYANMLMPLPSVEEQRAIACLLDEKTMQIDDLVTLKKRLIDLIHKRRQAILTRAVTKGLDPTAPMKDSGIDWLGPIPHRWSVLQFRRVIRALEQGWSPIAEDREAEADEWAVLKISAVAQGRFRPNEHKALPPNLEPESRYEVCAGDLLLTRSNTPERVGDACFVSNTRQRLILSDLIYRLHLDQRRCLHAFARYWLISPPGRAAIEADARGTSGSMVKIAQSHIRTWPILVPPVEQQHAIVQHLDREMRRLDGIVDKIEASIDCLCEYRTALISTAVTGKIDARKEIA